MKTTGLCIGLVGPLPPPFGGMANQLQQLAQFLRDEGVVVELIQVNSPYHPKWIRKIKGIRAVFRLFPYLIHLWQSANKVQLFHVFANSGWSWHLFAAPAIWIARLKKNQLLLIIMEVRQTHSLTKIFSGSGLVCTEQTLLLFHPVSLKLCFKNVVSQAASYLIL